MIDAIRAAIYGQLITAGTTTNLFDRRRPTYGFRRAFLVSLPDFQPSKKYNKHSQPFPVGAFINDAQ